MKAAIGLSAAVAIAAVSSSWSSAQAQSIDTNSSGMVDTRNLPHTQFYHHPLFIDVVRTGPIVHYPSDPEPAQPVWIDGQQVPIPRSTNAGLTTGQPVPASTVNPMLGNRQLPAAGWTTNIPAGGVQAPGNMLQPGWTAGVHSNMRPPGFPPARAVVPSSAKAGTPQGLPPVAVRRPQQVFKYNDQPSTGHSSGAASATTTVKATLTTKLLNQQP